MFTELEDMTITEDGGVLHVILIAAQEESCTTIIRSLLEDHITTSLNIMLKHRLAKCLIDFNNKSSYKKTSQGIING